MHVYVCLCACALCAMEHSSVLGKEVLPFVMTDEPEEHYTKQNMTYMRGYILRKFTSTNYLPTNLPINSR